MSILAMAVAVASLPAGAPLEPQRTSCNPITIAVKNNFERRIGIWPAGFDQDGVLYCDTAYGDYPHYLPHAKGQDHLGGMFAGWMLLNHQKPVRAFSTLGGFAPNLAVDEDLKTYWSAAAGGQGPRKRRAGQHS